MDVGAIIVTHRSPALAQACWTSLPTPVRRRSVVVVNAPDACPPGSLEGLGRHCTVLPNHGPLRGYGANVNAGLASLQQDVGAVLVLNDDVILNSGAVESLSAVLAQDGVGVVGPRITNPAGMPEASIFAFPTVASELAAVIILPAGISERWRARYADSAPQAGVTAADWVLGAAMLIRRDALDRLGGFDPGFFLYSEETDLCFRISGLGLRVLCCGHAVVVHTGSASTTSEQTQRLLGASRARYERLHWTATERRGLALATALALIWNAIFTSARIAINPRRTHEKLGQFSAHFRARSALRRAPRR